MNCPYCNKPCERLRKYDWVCDNCPVVAVFSNWDEYESPSYGSPLSSFLEVSLRLKSGLWVGYRPNTQEIEIYYDKPITFKISYLVTTNNIQEVYNRILNMKAFL